MFNTIEDLKSYQKYLRPLNENYIYYYLNTIYQYLLIREESQGADINEINSKNLFSNTLKQKANENGISLRNFLQYLDIQEFMCERLFKYLDKTKTGQLTKNEFVNGLDTIYYGNFQELYKLIFFMCDFNENGKLHKFNMKLILSYIPVKTYEEQQKYIKNINSIIDHYFTNLDKRFPEKNIKIDKEIDYDLYKNDIEDYIKESTNNNNKENSNNNFNNNGSFLLFIKLISYIYMNNPFNKDNMNFCKFLKNKFLMKLPKKLNNNNLFNTTSNTNNNTNTNNTNNINKEKENKNGTNNAENNDKDQLAKIRPNARSNSLYNNKKKKNNIYTTNIKPQKELLSSKDLPIENKNQDLLIFSMNINELKKAKLLQTGKKEKQGGFNLTPSKDKKDKKSGLNLDQDNEEIFTDKNIKNNDYADILYKYCEEDSSKFIKKYYGELRGKDILFFASKLKNELCTIWNISKCIIIPLEKINISKYTYYPIKFINYNKSFCLIYFEDNEKRNLFLKKCEENTSYIKIEDLFEFKEKIGQGNFGLVRKCIEKNTGKEYAVKIMDKNKIKKKRFAIYYTRKELYDINKTSKYSIFSSRFRR